MNINNLLKECGINSQYNLTTSRDIIIANAPYIDTCEELETLYFTNYPDRKVNAITDLQNQHSGFLKEYFQNNTADPIVMDNILMGILVIFAISMFILLLPNNCNIA